MESIAGQSSFLRVFRCFALVGVLALLLTGCSHTSKDCEGGWGGAFGLDPAVGMFYLAALPVMKAGCYALADTADWFDEDNLRTVSPEERDYLLGDIEQIIQWSQGALALAKKIIFQERLGKRNNLG